MMPAELDARQLNAFIDGELDLGSQLELERRLGHDAGLAAQVQQLRSLRQSVIRQADYHTAPASLRARLHELAAQPAPLATRASDVKAIARRWFAWRPLVSSFCALGALALVLNVTLMQAEQEERLGQEIIVSHARATLTQHLVDVASSDHHTVKPWLSSKLDFSPPVPELNMAGLTFLGGRLDYLDYHPVAVLMYRQGAHVISAFVWPAAGADRPATFSAQRGFQMAHWRRDGMVHWVISDLNRQEFSAIAHGLELGDGKH